MVRASTAWDIWPAVAGGGFMEKQHQLADAVASGDPAPIERQFDLNCDPLLNTRIGGGR